MKNKNDINLTCVEDNRNKKNSLYSMSKISIEKDSSNTNIILNNKNYKGIKPNNKYSITVNNNNNDSDMKNNKKITNKINDYNHMNQNKNLNMNQNSNQIMQYAKKLSARSNSYRINSHENNYGYINKKRKINYKYDLTESEEKITNNLKLNTSKSKNSQIINYSLVNNGLNFMNIGNNNFNTNDIMNKISQPNINNNPNRIDDKYYMKMQNSSKTPQIFNNYYSINGVVTSGSPIKVINVFNN